MLEYEIEKLKEELKVTDFLLEKRNKVLEAIPECPIHGNQCIPHAMVWIIKMLEKDKDVVDNITPKERFELLRLELIKDGWKILRDDFDIPYAVKHKTTGKQIKFSQVESFFLLTNKLPESEILCIQEKS